jgi:hypothetical protein
MTKPAAIPARPAAPANIDPLNLLPPPSDALRRSSLTSAGMQDRTVTSGERRVPRLRAAGALSMRRHAGMTWSARPALHIAHQIS